MISGQFDAFFRFMFVQALIGNSTNILNLGYRKSLKKEFALIQSSNFKAALMEILNPVFLSPRKDEEVTNFWTDAKCLELLARYNRLSLIIENGRKELKKNRKQKKEIQRKYGIQDKWIDLVDSIQNKKDLALEWAMDILNIESRMRDFYAGRKSTRIKNLADMNFEHIHNRILKRGRDICPTKNVLVYCTFYGTGKQLGSVKLKSDDVTLLKVQDWTFEESLGKSVFFEQASF